AGDGFVIARHLVVAAVRTKVYLIGSAARLKHDAAANYRRLQELNAPVAVIEKLGPAVWDDIIQADIVVDAIFGVGVNRKIGDPYRSIVEAINANAKKIIAVDIPSGLDGTTGKIYGVCVKAHTTVTFSFIKKGFLKARGPQYVGRVIVADIGLPNLLKKGIN
ncbi:MAG TPA: NAD(P)H-hydrate epimerase, partial [Candidatus Omnitrophota bacterium]|nr:NAD(P)H-hydrate epimerase [Candidatus Omnitrophota bacterium]